MLDTSFLIKFQHDTEELWAKKSLDRQRYGFQFQPGTKWNRGLSDQELSNYESFLGATLPDDFKCFLRRMNGTDLPTINLYGNSGHPVRFSVGVYSYPRDIEAIRQGITDVHENRAEIVADLAAQGFDLPDEAALVPFCWPRYIICTPNHNSSVVLSVVVDDVDAIVYARSFQEYLLKDFCSA